ncbi:MAG: Kazal-type serine protease inhibitor domain-containing protein [Shinella sp.]|nr:Kazal-type serine protease inhibitor domain-containing protein [Shinella sp.]
MKLFNRGDSKPSGHGRRAGSWRKLSILAFPLLAACTVDVAPGGGGGPRPGPPMCTMEYAPVCGARGRQLQTFANACQARSNGFDIVGRGECRPQRPERPERPERPDRACTREYAPVCGQRGRNTRTFPNACEARNSGFDVIGRGECRREPIREPEQRMCTREYAPVCARRGRSERTFGNSCEAGNSGYRVVHGGECR